jgi:alpha-galactosidase
MPKITLIGAGSYVFTRNLCNDILLTSALQDSTISLMDIDPNRLSQARGMVQYLVDRYGLHAKVEATTDRKEAIGGADYVVTTFQQGGLDGYALDIDIPRKFGVEQCVGDTLGPGGVFRALRTIPVLLDICDEMDEFASPDALLINYVNPMAANCWGVEEGSGRPFVGLCHSVQGTSELLASWCDVPYNEVNFVCAGINHQAFFLTFNQKDEDLYPRLWEAIQRPEICGSEPVRIELMKYFGYFVTESSGHASEYVPYFRKNAKLIEEDLVPRFTSPEDHWFDYGRTGGYLRHCQMTAKNLQGEFQEVLDGAKTAQEERSREYCSYIIEAIETNRPVKINGNVPNNSLITNLPDGCIVEVPCLVDASGIQPTVVGDVPVQLAGLNRTSINVQECVKEAVLNGDKEAVFHAVMLDPLTAAVCTLPQIHDMVTEMLEAQKHWLPEFED